SASGFIKQEVKRGDRPSRGYSFKLQGSIHTMSSFNLKSMLGQLPWSRPQGKEQKPAREPGSHYEHHLGQGAPQAEGFNNGVEKSSPMLQQYRHVALYFKNGAPLLLPVTAEQCEALTKCMQKPFVGLATYDNRFVVVRT